MESNLKMKLNSYSIKKFVVFCLVIILQMNCLKAKKSIFDFNNPTSSSILRLTPIPTPIPIALNYSGSPFTFTQGTAISTITSAVTGTVSSCTSSPNLPTGLILNNTTCSISGTPTTFQTTTNYTITASNSVGSTSTSISIQVTSNGSSWTGRTLPSVSNWSSVTYGNGLFVTVATSSSNAATSPDGVIWTTRTLPSSQQWQSVTFGNGVFVTVVNGSGQTAASSSDGINWTASTTPNLASYRSVAYGNGIFVAVANASLATLTSP